MRFVFARHQAARESGPFFMGARQEVPLTAISPAVPTDGMGWILVHRALP